MEATVKWITNPVTSTRVATNGAEALAGSNPIRCRMNGSIDPVSEPNMTMPTRATATVSAISIQRSP
jgi:hypothetical protein